ncbi:hypothetical protein [Chondrinema litorale]|uniref:hypothetical protein n=1 Tax=Chondrinema litorale TaxID=2994555 RepID=UPI002543DBB0|nr:hypothetical protein [Chondrinema litorale]UZR99287.1 hypothetical protein OQ292_35485 [Chondrinema litorale]
MSNPIICPTCKVEYGIEPAQCNHCGFPFAADDKAKSKFIADQIIKKGSIGDTTDRLNVSRNILFAIAAVNLFYTFLLISNLGFNIISIFDLVVVATFLFFGFYIKKKPLISVVIPLSLLIFFYILQALIDINILFNGIVWKIVFIMVLSFSIYSILKSEKIKKESSFLSKQKY